MNFWQIIWLMLWFALFAVWVFVVISVFVDVFRRQDLSGIAKALWTLVVIAVPLVGVLAYIAMRPRMTAREARDVAAFDQAVRPDAEGSAAEIARLARLRAEGEITDEDFAKAKQHLV